MPDRVELVLDNMITAVDEGLSYDGIVSIPEIGLEDVVYRVGLAGWLDDSAQRFREAISKVADRFFPKAPLPGDDKTSAADSKFSQRVDTVEVRGAPHPQDSPSPQDSPTLQEPPTSWDSAASQDPPAQTPHINEELQDEDLRDVGQKSPRKRIVDEEDGEGGQVQSHPSIQEVLPREAEQASENSTRWSVDQSLPMAKNDEVAHPSNTDRISTKWERQPRLATSSTLPRLKREEKTISDDD